MANRPNTFNTFKQEAEKRQEQQQQIEAQLTGSEESKAEEIKSKKRVRMNITLPPEHKKRLETAARKKSVSASYLIQSWIEDHCE